LDKFIDPRAGARAVLGGVQMTVVPPGERLAPFVGAFRLVATSEEATRLLIPEPGLVLAFRYGGSASLVEGSTARPVASAAITGIVGAARRMRTSAGGGVLVVAFRPAGAAQFFAEPLHQLFGNTVALADLVPRRELDRVASRVMAAADARQRVAAVEDFLLARLRPVAPDPVVAAAVREIRETRGALRIGALARRLGISQDPLEKRFRRVAGASPKQLASIVRLRHAIDGHRAGKSLTRLAQEAGFFDQSHFNRAFRAFTGQAPGRFLGSAQHW
jgi:AraC-like DNA-binding protein